ncbi:hypothetical protein ACRAWD_09170 [Caulobacter segnis]
MVVDGDLRMNKINGCNSRNGKILVKVRGVGEVSYDNFPQIAIRVPDGRQGQARRRGSLGDIGRVRATRRSGQCRLRCDWTVKPTPRAS